MNSTLIQRLKAATVEIAREGTVGEGSNKQSEYDVEYYCVPGYYPQDETYLLGVDVDSQWVNSASLSVQYELTNHDLLTNSFYLDEFTGYGDDETHIEHDLIFHVVPIGWLPDREGPKYD